MRLNVKAGRRRPGRAGAGGSATLSVDGAFSSQADVTLTGGAGGSATLNVGGAFSSQGDVTLTGGAGGAGANANGGAGGAGANANGGAGGASANANGGAGGSATLNVGRDMNAGNTTLNAGAGGLKGPGANGGAGGSVLLTVGGNVSSSGDVNLTGGNSALSGAGHYGGMGGSSALNAAGVLSVAGSLNITGGGGGDSNNSVPGVEGGAAVVRAAGTAAGGALVMTSGPKGGGTSPGLAGIGGAAELETNWLYAPSITLTRPTADAGALRFTVGNLYVPANTSLVLTNTVAADISIGGYRFDLAGVSSGATMLAITGNGNINSLDPAMSMSLTGGGKALPTGYSFTLINDQSLAPFSGGPAPATLQAQQGATLLYGFDVAQAGNALTATLNSGPYAEHPDRPRQTHPGRIL